MSTLTDKTDAATEKKAGLGTMTKKKHILMDEDRGKAWSAKRRESLRKKKVNYLRNKAVRADLYAKYKGELKGGSGIEEWNRTLRALSHGTI